MTANGKRQKRPPPRVPVSEDRGYGDILNTMQFAIIETGGKQYEVSEGSVIQIEKINSSSSVGDTIDFSTVLLVDDGSTTLVGTECVDKKVTGTIEEIGKQKKVEVVKFKAKSDYRRHYGHRQPFWKVKIHRI